jgi:hypothetical protein
LVDQDTRELASFAHIRTPEDARRYIDALSSKRGRDLPSVARWRRASHVTLFVLVAFSGIQLYFMNIYIEILSMPSLSVFVLSGLR